MVVVAIRFPYVRLTRSLFFMISYFCALVHFGDDRQILRRQLPAEDLPIAKLPHRPRR